MSDSKWTLMMLLSLALHGCVVLRTCFCLLLHKPENPCFNVAQWYRRCIQGLWVGIFDDPDEVNISKDLYQFFDIVDKHGQVLSALSNFITCHDPPSLVFMLYREL